MAAGNSLQIINVSSPDLPDANHIRQPITHCRINCHEGGTVGENIRHLGLRQTLKRGWNGGLK
jgi:hypothetical protein